MDRKMRFGYSFCKRRLNLRPYKEFIMSRSLFFVALFALSSFPAMAVDPELETIEAITCNGVSGSNHVSFYISKIGPIQNENAGFFEQYRRGQFVLHVAVEGVPEYAVESFFGSGTLKTGMTKHISISFKGTSKHNPAYAVSGSIGLFNGGAVRANLNTNHGSYLHIPCKILH